MKCPLLTVALIKNYERRREGDDDCTKGGCAWWNEAYSCCQLVELVNALSGIELCLRGIKEQMPSGQSFVK